MCIRDSKTTIRNLLSKYGYLSVEMEKAFNYEAESDERAMEIDTDHQLPTSNVGTESNVIDLETTSFEDLSQGNAPQGSKPQGDDDVVVPY